MSREVLHLSNATQIVCIRCAKPVTKAPLQIPDPMEKEAAKV